MMISKFFRHSDWLVFLSLGLVLLLMAEFGYRIGCRHKPEMREKHQSQIGTLQGALLGLLGLLLGFTFAMAVGHFDARKQLVQDEANGICMVWLRAALLSDEARDSIRPVLQDYVQARLEWAKADLDSEEFEQQLMRSEGKQVVMWQTAVSELKNNDSAAVELFAESLNDMIDLNSKRKASVKNHVPGPVWLLLAVVSSTVCWTTGYATALAGAGRHALPMAVLPVLLAIVITIIADLDNPRRGLLHVSQQSMIDLRDIMQRYQ